MARVWRYAVHDAPRVKSLSAELRVPALVAQVGCGQGLLLHLLAMRGLACVGVDPHATNLELARQCVANRPYPAARPRFEQQVDGRHVPLVDSEVDLLLLFGQMERHPNPVGLLREASRVVEEGIATHAEVNDLMVDCFNWPVGPFAMVKGASDGWK